MPPRLFAYGTLIPGRLRWPLLAPYSISHRRAEVVGTLFDSGLGWPVAAFDATAETRVPGVLVELAPATLAECLVVIDEVEDTATGELRRIEVITVEGDRAWAYHYTRSTAGLASIERWESVDTVEER